MKIAILSNLISKGGSEFRCVDTANMLSIKGQHNIILIGVNGINKRIEQIVKNNVSVIHVMEKDTLNGIDVVLVVCSNSNQITKQSFWISKDCSTLKRVVFLFNNFNTSQYNNLQKTSKVIGNIRIICTSKWLLDSIGLDFTKAFLPSPIDDDRISTFKVESNKVRIGRHSRTSDKKFDTENMEIIRDLNEELGTFITWDFMGIPNKEEFKRIENSIIRSEFSREVTEYLEEIDIFMFFPQWSRKEPWSRCVIEGMLSGCPVVTSNRYGNMEQIQHGINGFLCDKKEDFIKYLKKLVLDKTLRHIMGNKAKLSAQAYTISSLYDPYKEFMLEGLT